MSEITANLTSRFNDVKQFIEDIEHSQDFNTIISLEDTEDLMYSSDFKDRFKAEYYQTKIRYEKLKAFNNRIEASSLSENVKEPVHDCPLELLRKQQNLMGQYLGVLELVFSLHRLLSFQSF